MLKILSICAALSFLFVSGAMAQSGGGAQSGDGGNRVSVPAGRISKKSAATSNRGATALPLASRSMSQTFPTRARQGWPVSPRLEQHAARTSRSINAVPKVAFRKWLASRMSSPISAMIARPQ